jgi:putative transposase
MAKPTSFACCRYIELNPVRARMVPHPRLSLVELRAHAHGATDALVSGHDLYRRLDRTQAGREKAYRALFRTALDSDFVDGLQAATLGAY